MLLSLFVFVTCFGVVRHQILDVRQNRFFILSRVTLYLTKSLETTGGFLIHRRRRSHVHEFDRIYTQSVGDLLTVFISLIIHSCKNCIDYPG